MTKYEGYALRDILLEGLGDAVKAHMLNLWNVAMKASAGDIESGHAIQAFRNGIGKTQDAYNIGIQVIEEMVNGQQT